MKQVASGAGQRSLGSRWRSTVALGSCTTCGAGVCASVITGQLLPVPGHPAHR